ncbi:MAG: dihydrofolate reductase family protein [Actinobacteria bacterium]|nr:dihydrofolate reductase family protein [Actinomycetota bacterium]
MRDIVVVEYLSVDGVMQAPGYDGEDSEGRFEQGGWTQPHLEEHRAYLTDVYRTAGGFLLGRLTYQIWAEYWPAVTDESDEIAHALNSMPKYVASTTLTDPAWSGTTLLRDDIPGEVRRLKQGSGGDIVLAGSSKLAHTLMAQDLVDRFVLMIHPIVLGSGKRLFEPGGRRAALKLIDTKATPGGLAILTFARADDESRGVT